MLLYQPSSGYCYNSDSIFLTDFIRRFRPRGRLLDVGCGVGVISLLLARDFPVEVTLSEKQPRMLAYARHNFGIHGFDVEAAEGDFLEAPIGGTFDFIVSNPPYIADDCKLESNVADYEPHEALFGGRRGDELLKRIIDDVKDRDIGWLVCEMGYDQKAPIQAYVNEIGVKSIAFYKDLAEHDRGFVIDFG